MQALRWEQAARVPGSWGARRGVVGGEAPEAGQLRSHGLESLGKDFEPHPKK